ncbi:MAG: glycosyltransferase family 2 protein [Cyclobacteriaceae bacterium]
MKVSVIISTYNTPVWLEKVLWGYTCQEHSDFEIIIADDGSGKDTHQVIRFFQENTSLEIHHAWHEDQGYRRQTILNHAIIKASTDYLIFTDGDCIPRNDFITTHVEQAERGYFLSGGYCKLSMEISKKIAKENILNRESFDLKWLRAYGSVGMSQSRKLNARGKWANFLDSVTTAKPTFNNCNSSAWKSDLLAVNGYDERMQYGGSDREIGERLMNYGVVGKQIRHRAIVLHLDHARGYKTDESIEKNVMIRKKTRKLKVSWTQHGIVK